MKLCPALKKAKITDPESQAGKDFCTESCPYPDCIAVVGDTLYKMKIAREKSRAQRFYKKGMTIQEIAAKIGKSTRTVERYLS